MDLVYFHSDLQYLANALEQDVTVTHTSLAGITGSGQAGIGVGSSQPIADGDVRGTAIDLVTHNFGYPPITFVLLNGEILSGGTLIQSASTGARYASSWSDNTKAGLFETAFSSASALPSVSRTYKVLCFRSLSGDPSLPTLRFSPGENLIVLGRKISSDARPLRVPALVGDAEFYVPLEPVLDARNGAVRSISPISGTVDLGFYTGSFFTLKSVLMSNS
jgi:hypothetical protein